MFKYLLLSLALFSGLVHAGYDGKDPVELAKTVDIVGNKYNLYSLDLNDGFTMVEPICHDRNQMFVITYEGRLSTGCWWKVGRQIFGYSPDTGVTRFNMDLMLVNDNFTGQTPKGF